MVGIRSQATAENNTFGRLEIAPTLQKAAVSSLKMGLYGTFRHGSKENLQRYRDELDFRWKNKKASDIERTVAALANTERKRLTYRWTNSKDSQAQEGQD